MIRRSEFIFIVVAFCVIFSFSQLPLLAGYALQTEELQFPGRVLGLKNFYNVQDWMIQAKEGHFLFTTYATPEKLPYFFLNTYFWFLGNVSALLNIDTVTSYLLFSIVGGFLFFVALYSFISLLSENTYFRKVAFIITLLSSGIGILFWGWIKSGNIPYVFAETTSLAERVFPVDLWLSDAFPLLSLYAYPYHIAAMVLMLGTFIFFMKGWEKQRFMPVAIAGILTLILGSFHPYDPLTIYAVVTLFSLVSMIIHRGIAMKVKMYILFLAISLPSTLFNVYVFLFDSAFSDITTFNIQVSPNPYSYLLGAALPFLFALYYLIKKVIPRYKSISTPILFTTIWTITNYMLAYAPTVIQRKLILGMHIPLALLATLAIFEYVLPRFDPRKAKIVLIILILVMMPTTIFFIAKETYKVGAYGETFFVHVDDLEAITWIDENVNREDVIFSGIVAGGRITAKSQRVFLGHVDMTLNSTYKRSVVDGFFSEGIIDNQRLDILRENNIQYVYYGKEEREMGNIDIETLNFLEKVFENERVILFKVVGG